MDNLADITLQGYAIKLIRFNGPMAFNDIAFDVSKCYDALRRSDGSKYTGDFKKALKGSLTSSDIFQEMEGSIWTINETKAKIYETKTTEKIKQLISKQKQKGVKKTGKRINDSLKDNENSERNDVALSESSRSDLNRQSSSQSLNKKRAFEEYSKVFDTLNMSLKAYKMEDKANYFLPNSLNEIKGTETLDHLSQKFGKDKMNGILECFHYFLPILEEYMSIKSPHLGRLSSQNDNQ